MNKTIPLSWKILLLVPAWAIYLISLSQPAMTFEHREPISGLYVLCWGWWGILTFNFAWFANPSFVAGSVALLRGKSQLAALCGVVAVALSFHSLAAKEWWFNEGSGTRITGLGIAFKLWVISLGSLLVAAIVQYFWQLRKSAQQGIQRDGPASGGSAR